MPRWISTGTKANPSGWGRSEGGGVTMAASASSRRGGGGETGEEEEGRRLGFGVGRGWREWRSGRR
jgi:hypothetical protein